MNKKSKNITQCPIKSIQDALAFSSRDFTLNHRDAWIWGIANGWKDHTLLELQVSHGWTDETVARLKMLHKKFISLEEHEKELEKEK